MQNGQGSFFHQRSLSRLLTRGALFVSLAFIATSCIIGLPLEDSQVAEHCPSNQQSQDKDDTTVMLQSGRLKVERLSEEEFEDQEKHTEARQQQAEPQLPCSLSHLQGTRIKFLMNTATHLKENTLSLLLRTKAFKEKTLSLLSRGGLQAADDSLEGRGGMGVWLLLAMILCTCVAFCGILLPSLMDTNDEKKSFFRGGAQQPQVHGSGMPMPGPPGSRPMMTPSQTPIRLSGPGMTSPILPQSTPLIKSVAQPVVGRPTSRLTSGSMNEPFVNSSAAGQLSAPYSAHDTPMASLVSVPPIGSRVDDQAVSKRLPPPLCPTLVLPVCEARFGVPMFEIAALTTEGDLGIVGLSGNPLLRASVRKVGRRRSLEISMPEAGSAPRATIGPNLQDLNRPDDGALEIRGLKGSFYGLLEMRNSGACYVTKDGETMMIIDGDTESLQLSIKSGGGLPLASVRCSTEPFGGVDHVEIRVEPGVDTVLVLACVLAVLLLSPSS